MREVERERGGNERMGEGDKCEGEREREGGERERGERDRVRACLLERRNVGVWQSCSMCKYACLSVCLSVCNKTRVSKSIIILYIISVGNRSTAQDCRQTGQIIDPAPGA